MQNSGVIIKIEYKYTEADSFNEIQFTPRSAKLNQDAKKTGAGVLHTTKVPFKIAKNEKATKEPISTLLNRKAIYRVTDGNYTTYTLGDDEIKARLNYSLELGGSPGSFNGREVEITWQSTNGAIID
ncbi:MAG: hypothetical protein PF489_13515 [Salinivirgaceae bacterium]|jgi:hypothetical protein|nr:hypothetical protein [Salinivirgaceae bacterium]